MRYLTICFIAVLTGLNFLSCSSDDDNPIDSNPIVGTWATPVASLSSDYNSEGYVMFCADGTMYNFADIDFHGLKSVMVNKMEYVYNAAKNSLLIIDESGHSVTYEVFSLTNAELTIGYGSGSGYDTYKKTKSPYTQEQLEKLYQEQK